MSPEFGATATIFPIDDETIAYLRLTGRSPERVALVERYAKEQGLWREPGDGPAFDELLTLDLGSVEPSLAGPRRPQDRVPLQSLRENFRSNFPEGLVEAAALAREAAERRRRHGGVGRVLPGVRPDGLRDGRLRTRRSTGRRNPWPTTARPVDRRSYPSVEVSVGGQTVAVQTGSVAIAAITSCTNTSNPTVMVGAGLLARNAIARGLRVAPTVKTSLAPGSRAVTGYLEAAGLMAPLAELGFALAGYGCTTCIGNSGPLDAPVAEAIEANDLVVAAVLSGNRNFEGRIHPLARASYLASPPLVVAFALAGRVDIDLSSEPLGVGADGSPVFLADIWPAPDEIRSVIADSIDPELFRPTYAVVFEGDERWRALPIPEGDRYAWDPALDLRREAAVLRWPLVRGRRGPATSSGRAPWPSSATRSRPTTSRPAGSIAPWSPAGTWLQEHGVGPLEFNSYGARRGHHEVMMRGTFGNIRLRNRLAEGKEGPYTTHLPSGDEMFIYDAAMRYGREGVPLVVLAGREYGSGSSRDWAAKGTTLLGVQGRHRRVVRADPPLEPRRDGGAAAAVQARRYGASLGLTGRETFSVVGLADGLVAAAVGDGRGRARRGGRRRRRRGPVRGDRPAGRPDRGRLLPRRGHPARRPAPARDRAVSRAAAGTKKPPGEDRGLHRGGGCSSFCLSDADDPSCVTLPCRSRRCDATVPTVTDAARTVQRTYLRADPAHDARRVVHLGHQHAVPARCRA